MKPCEDEEEEGGSAAAAAGGGGDPWKECAEVAVQLALRAGQVRDPPPARLPSVLGGAARRRDGAAEGPGKSRSGWSAAGASSCRAVVPAELLKLTRKKKKELRVGFEERPCGRAGEEEKEGGRALPRSAGPPPEPSAASLPSAAGGGPHPSGTLPSGSPSLGGPHPSGTASSIRTRKCFG